MSKTNLKISDFSWCGTVPDQLTFERASKIQLLLMDVDGVLTDSRIYYMPDQNGSFFETKGFDSYDGLGFHMLKAAGIKTGFISGRDSQAVTERARNMSVAFLYQGHLNKQPILEEILSKSSLTKDQIAYIGDDFTDAPILKQVGLACAVANARSEIKKLAHFTTQSKGSEGAVREVIELILKARGNWEQILQTYGVL